MTQLSLAQQAAHYIQQKSKIKPSIAIILGSGLGKFAQTIEQATHFSYNDLPGFVQSTVKGHQGQLILGQLQGIDIACLQGRCHYYEQCDYQPVKNYIRTLKLLGCKTLIITNASGSIKPDMAPGELVVISDHINFQPNPLAGPNDDEFGPRFPSMTNAYDTELRTLCLQQAKQLDIKIHEGVYVAVTGPSFETAAEIQAFRTLGADVVGMSTAAEVIIARHCDLNVLTIATITNFATGLKDCVHDHNEVLATATRTASQLQRLINAVIKVI